MLKEYVSIMEEIKNESGRIAKENLLKKYEDVEGLQEIFKFVFNPLIVTGLAKKKIEKEVNVPYSVVIANIFDMMNFVKDNNTGNDIVIATVQNFLSRLDSEEERELAKSILVKDLPIGLSRTTLNKVYGKDFINKYGVMLAEKFEKHEKKLTGPFAATLKLDGNRVTFFTFEDGIKVYTRSGKEVEGLTELMKDFEKMPKNWVFDGELLAENPNGLPSKELFNVTQTIARKKGEKTGLEFVVFDGLPINEFNDGISKLGYRDRQAELDVIFFEHVAQDMRIKRVPVLYVGDDKNKIPELLTEVEKQGLEGIMINTLDGKYQTKRTKDLLKVKTFYTVDLRCLGINEEVRGGKCGSVTVDYKGYQVNVPILKDVDQERFWNNPELIVGKIIEVKFFEESKNKQGGISLRFPSFVMVRDDKNEVSYE